MEYKKSSPFRAVGFMAFDAAVVLLSYALAYLAIVINPNIVFDQPYLFLYATVIAVGTVFIFYIFNVYNVMVKHIGIYEVSKILILLFAINFIVVMLLLTSVLPLFMHKTQYFFITSMQMFFIIGSRIAIRMRVVITQYRRMNQHSARYLIIGAGTAGRIALEEIHRKKDGLGYVVGFLDDNPTLLHRQIGNARIIGNLEQVETCIEEKNVTHVIIAIKEYPADKTRHLLNKLSKLNVKIQKLNLIDSVNELDAPKLQEIKIEDLLERNAIILNTSEISETIAGKVVLVTGGGGSIGSELCRQIFSFRPKTLIIFDIYENNAYDIQMELLRLKSKAKQYKDVELVTLIGSVYNKNRLETVFATYKPDMVYHAAAYKHVPLMEDSPMEAIRTNVVGTYYCSRLAKKYGAKKFVLVSTDKAVRPTNVMGATKRFAELVVETASTQSNTIFTAVRFGNVLGSNGSVVPLFRKQIEDGGPVTVTDPEITRFFMTIPEAVGLILQCGFYANNNEVFVLDMGSPVKIYELAKKMIHLSGYTPDVDIKIEFVGLRPGEKMYEELLIDTASTNYSKTSNNKIFVEKQKDFDVNDLNIDYIIQHLDQFNIEDSVNLLLNTIDTYHKVEL